MYTPTVFLNNCLNKIRTKLNQMKMNIVLCVFDVYVGYKSLIIVFIRCLIICIVLMPSINELKLILNIIRYLLTW